MSSTIPSSFFISYLLEYPNDWVSLATQSIGIYGYSVVVNTLSSHDDRLRIAKEICAQTNIPHNSVMDGLCYIHDQASL